MAAAARMRAFGAELILVGKEEGMEGARDLALEMTARGDGFMLNQFANPDNLRRRKYGAIPLAK